ncbi:tRNA(Ile)-lysidine synthase [Dirofilaria immitis]
MLIKGIEIEPEPNVNLLLILCDSEEITTDDDTFRLLCEICATKIVNDRTKFYWLRHQAPRSLPKELTLEPWQLSRITLRYFNEKLIDGVIASCASVHTSFVGEVAVIVEFHESDIPHEESLSTILALLSDIDLFEAILASIIFYGPCRNI